MLTAVNITRSGGLERGFNVDLGLRLWRNSILIWRNVAVRAAARPEALFPFVPGTLPGVSKRASLCHNLESTSFCLRHMTWAAFPPRVYAKPALAIVKKATLNRDAPHPGCRKNNS